MVYQAVAPDTHADRKIRSRSFTFDAGNSLQPKTNYCASCAAHKQAICARLQGRELEAFSASSTHHVFKPGQMIFSEFDDALTVYTVVSGDVRLSRMLDDGRRQITSFKSKGDFIGLSTSGHYTSDAEAINDVVVCQFTAHALKNSLEEFNALQSRLMEMMQEEMMTLQDHMVVLGRKTPVEKIASFLMERVRRVIDTDLEEITGEVAITLPMTRADIADFLGLTIETVSRTFTKLRKQGLIELKSAHDISITDLYGLELLASSAH
ncbi:helix-turn-helix domain-containing protein [Sneathiella glossodoripedis]|uniref:helix-turn-helix domain-containing protein n=1 Tax=Sneathiella glossodoripedis TaxID=418853 RepID=UPI00131F2A9B|nr:helix-turn-helix domain-containing protein [Sneathiella glossodoripedis]